MDHITCLLIVYITVVRENSWLAVINFIIGYMLHKNFAIYRGLIVFLSSKFKEIQDWPCIWIGCCTQEMHGAYTVLVREALRKTDC